MPKLRKTTLYLFAGLAIASLANGEQDPEKIRKQLVQINEQFSKSQSRLSTAEKELRNSEQRLEETAKKLMKNHQASRLAKENLQEIKQRLPVLDHQLEYTKTQIESSLRAVWRNGRGGQIKIILNQDKTRQLSRMLAYYEILAQGQLQQLKHFRGILREKNAVIHKQNKLIIELGKREEKLKRQQEELDRRRTSQIAILKTLNKDHSLNQQRLEETEHALKKLLEKLQKEQLAFVPRTPIRSLYGKLPVPLKGEIIDHYYNKEYIRSGLLFRAPWGRPVRTVHEGRVIVSRWEKYYRNLVIIDHGQNLYSLYAYNETLLCAVGDQLSAGQTIATTGSDGLVAHGLYFELRERDENDKNKTKVINALPWFRS